MFFSNETHKLLRSNKEGNSQHHSSQLSTSQILGPNTPRRCFKNFNNIKDIEIFYLGEGGENNAINKLNQVNDKKDFPH